MCKNANLQRDILHGFRADFLFMHENNTRTVTRFGAQRLGFATFFHGGLGYVADMFQGVRFTRYARWVDTDQIGTGSQPMAEDQRISWGLQGWHGQGGAVLSWRQTFPVDCQRWCVAKVPRADCCHDASFRIRKENYGVATWNRHWIYSTRTVLEAFAL